MPPVISSRIRPQDALSEPLTILGAICRPDGLVVLRDGPQELEEVLEPGRLLPLEEAGQIFVDAVVGRGVDAHQRQAQQAGRVDLAGGVDRQEPALDLADPLVHELFGDADVDAVRGPAGGPAGA